MAASCWAMSTAASLSVTHSSTVTSEQIDELGHMNVRWYGANAAAATAALSERLGLGAPAIATTYTRHHHEQLEGNRLEVRSGVLGGTDRLRFFHELRNAETDDLAATFVHDLDHPAIETPAIELPDYGKSRTINLNSDRVASAPSLAELRDRNLEIRLAREVTTDDTMGADVVPTWLTNNLFWGGERADGEESWIRETADGDRVAFASMETRVNIIEPVRVGTQIQSFGAVIHIGSKIVHELNWVYDLDREQLVTVAEAIDLAFSIPNRRSREMPPELRDREADRFHPEFDR